MTNEEMTKYMTEKEKLKVEWLPVYRFPSSDHAYARM